MLTLRRLLFLFLLLATSIAHGQGEPNWDWWAKNVNWDGVTHWSRYIILSPGYMGPNALPVPEVTTGRVNNDIRFEVGGVAHFGQGDRTNNLFTQLKFNVAKDIISLHLIYVPIEQFKISDATRDERLLSGHFYEAEGTTSGDFHFGFEVQLLKDKKVWPDIMLRANTKTASGSAIGAARFTDASGYSFDFSFGKTFQKNPDSNKSLRAYFMAGFYAWQTNGELNRQNEGFLTGLGADFRTKKILFRNALGGYFGWVNDRDKPIVYRTKLNLLGNHLDYGLTYQIGLQHFEYNSIMLSVIVHFDRYQKKEEKSE